MPSHILRSNRFAAVVLWTRDPTYFIFVLEDGPWLGFGVEDALVAPWSRNTGNAVQYLSPVGSRQVAQPYLHKA